MLLVSAVRQDFETFKKGLEKRGISHAEKMLQELIHTDDDRKRLQQQVDDVLSRSNLLAKQIGDWFKAGQINEANSAKEETAQLKSQSKDLQLLLDTTSEKLKNLLLQIPNIPLDIVPQGKSSEDNIIVKSGGVIPDLDEGAVPHWELIRQFNLIDFELGNKVTGAGFPFYRGAGARLIRGMVNYFLDEAIQAGYEEIQPPILINEDSGMGTGQLPDKEGQMYKIEGTNLYLIPTAEVPITNIYRDTILDEKKLPIKNAGFTPCFRREAGSWGAHVRGLNRLHQFDKIEIVQITTPQQSDKALEEMVEHVEKLVRSLELPYRILRLCGGDMGFTSALTYDFEVYSAAQQKWLEVSSVSTFQNYQANRLKLRYRTATGKNELAHTLNGSALAIPRILAALLENNQTKNEILIPEVLKKYTGLDKISL